jgi:hypothetical protein
MTSVAIDVKVSVPSEEEIRSRFGGAEWTRLLEQIANDVGATVRKNMVVHGSPSGDWPPLQGFNGNRVDTGRRNTKGAKITTKKNPRNKSRHVGYARRKEAGKTPGAGNRRADVRLRDTDALSESIRGVFVEETGVTRVYVDAPGKVGDRPANIDLLVWHATGAGNLPVRNPAAPSDMQELEARIKKRLEEILQNPVASTKPAQTPTT